jgi:hypothetical protein
MKPTLRDQLAAAFSSEKHKLNLYKKGRTRPPYNDLNVEQTLKKFKEDFLPMCPLTDRLGREIKVGLHNFRKLAGIEHKSIEEIRAWQVVQEIENGAFNLDNYTVEEDRIRTLFWVPDVLGDPDAIYKNAHATIRAEEVFLCVYDKLGSNIKLVFTSTFGESRNRRREIVTSYLTDAKGALSCIKGQPIY